MAKKRDLLRVIDQKPAVQGGGGIIQQAESKAPPIIGEIPPPRDLTFVSTTIARSSQAPMAYINISWQPPQFVTPEYYIVEYSLNSNFANSTRERAYETSASLLVNAGMIYYIHVQAVYRQAISAFTTSLTQLAASDTSAPSDVSAVAATFVYGDLSVTWTEPAPTNETYKDARIRIWNAGRTVLYATYHLRGGAFVWTEAENIRLTSGGVTSLSVDVTSRGWNNVYGTPQIVAVTLTTPSAVTGLTGTFIAGDLDVTWTNPNSMFRDVEVKVYESASKATTYKTYYIMGNRVQFTEADNYTANGSTPDTSLYVEAKVRSWLGAVSSAATVSATLTAPNPVTSVVADFTTGNLDIKWVNPSNTSYRDVEIKLYESASKVTNYKTYYINGNKITFSVEENAVATAGVYDTAIYYEIIVRSWLGVTSTTASGTATHTAPSVVTSVVTDFTTGDLDIKWTNPTDPFKDIEIKLYESSSKVTNYKTYYIQGNKITFTVEENYTATAGTPDTAIYYEIKSRSWLGLLSTAVSGTATHTAPGPVTSVSTDFTTGDLDIKWTNPSTVFKDIEIKLYESSSKVTNYKTYYLQGNNVTFTVEENFVATGNNPDPSIYYEIKARSWLGLLSTAVTATVTKAVPSAPANVTHTWTGDDGTYSATVVFTWDAQNHLKDYEITIDSVAYYPSSNRFEYTYNQNVADHIGSGNFGDYALSYAVKARDRLLQLSSATSGTATNAAPPAGTVITLTAVGGFSTIGAYIDLTTPIKDIMSYVWELHDGTSVVDTITSVGQTVSFDDIESDTYTVRVHAVDLFNRSGSTVTSSAVVIDAITIADLRAEAKYTDSQSRTSPALDVLKDEDVATTVNYNNTPTSGSFNWTKITRPLLDRYGILSYLAPDVTEVYFGVSQDDVTYTWYAGPVDSEYLVTEAANEGAARTNRISLAALTARRFQLPETTEARFIKVGHRSNNAGNYLIAEMYPRRIVQSDDIEAESIQTINLAAGIITADKTTTTMLNATFAYAGEIEVNTGGKIRSGQTAYNTGTGFYLGNDAGTPKFSIGNASGHRMTWDGSVLAIRSGASNSILLDGSGIVMSSGGIIRAGQTAYDTGTGFYLGNDAGTPKFSVGNSAGTKLTWDGSNLLLSGGGFTIETSAGSSARIEFTSSGILAYNSSDILQAQINATTGFIEAGNGAVTLSRTGITITAGGELRSGQTAYDTGTGFWMGLFGGVPKISIGSNTGNKMTWDGTTLSVVSGPSSSMTFDSSGIILSSGGIIRAGQTAYNTGTGFYLGNDSGTPKISVGNASGNKMTWDGTTLSLITGPSSSMTFGSGGIVMSSGGIIRAGQTAYDTGTGFYLGNDAGTPKFSVGNASGDKLTWNGTELSVTGQFNLSGVATIGTSGGLYHGSSGSFASPGTGIKLFSSGGSGKLSAYNSGVEQVTIDTDGIFKAGGGDVILDSNGIRLNASSAGISKNIRYRNSANTIDIGSISATIGSTRNEMSIVGSTSGGKLGKVFLYADVYEFYLDGAGTSYTNTILSASGLNLGTATGATTGQLKASAGIFAGSTDAGGTGSGSNDLRPSGSNTLTIGSTDAYNTPPKARLIGNFKYTSGGTYTNGPYIEFAKENATDGNYSFNMSFWTRLTGNSVAEAMRITPERTVLIGRTSGLTGAGELDVSGRARADTFETDGEGSKWKLSGYTAGALTISGYVLVNIDGVDRKLAVVT
jgi:hypothetical protein